MKRKAFSLVEVLMAVAVLSLGLIPVLVMTSGSVRDTGFNQRRVLAHRFLIDSVEVFRGEEFANVKAALASGGAAPDGFVKADMKTLLRIDLDEPRWAKTKGIFDKMKAEIHIKLEEDFQGQDGLAQLTVRVLWSDKEKADRKIEFVRMLYDPVVLETRISTEG